MKTAMTIVISLTLLVGCTPKRQYTAQPRDYWGELRGHCSAMGFQIGSDRHSQCMLSLHQQNEANMGAIGAAIMGGQAAGQAARPLPSCRGLPVGVAGFALSRGQCQ